MNLLHCLCEIRAACHQRHLAHLLVAWVVAVIPAFSQDTPYEGSLLHLLGCAAHIHFSQTLGLHGRMILQHGQRKRTYQRSAICLPDMWRGQELHPVLHVILLPMV